MSNISRRNFLRATALSGAALASSRFTVSILAEEAKGANDKISIAVIGVRGRGGNHIDGYLASKNCAITYLVDVDETVGKNCADKLEKRQGFRPKFVKDMRDILADESLDTVSIATPNHWHSLQAIWAMRAGKDVYAEKPVCQNLFEGRTLVAAVKKYQRICQVGTQCRSNQGIIEAIKFIHQGGIGEVKLARGLCYKRRKSIGQLGDYPIPEGVDFDLWSGPAIFTDPKVTRKQFHYDWHWQRLYGNGDSGNQGPHQTDIARWGLGLMRHPNKIITYGGRLGYQAERKNPDYIDAGDTPNTEVSILDYGDKTIIFETRGLETPALDNTKIGVIFYGSEGKLVQRSYTHSIAYDKEGKVIKEFKGGDDGNHYRNFISCVRSRKSEDLNAPVMDGYLSACMAILGNASYYVGEKNYQSVENIQKALQQVDQRDDNAATLARTVEHLKANKVDLEKYPLSLGPELIFDPEKEIFTNHDDANKELTRQWRDGYVCPSAEEV
ncbi:MAG: Gfo/Idh/MocA family oxidoreductase [Planctomycetia bacterium]|nr:Gfo/Idh/MocA family oxidoreductase [Planctomycetia bacterium]